MREIHGVADAKKIMMMGETDDTAIRVVDGIDRVIIALPHVHEASVTPEQARYIASCLETSAARVEGMNQK